MAFMALLGKLLPTQVTGKDGGAILNAFDPTTLTDAELAARNRSTSPNCCCLRNAAGRASRRYVSRREPLPEDCPWSLGELLSPMTADLALHFSDEGTD